MGKEKESKMKRVIEEEREKLCIHDSWKRRTAEESSRLWEYNVPKKTFESLELSSLGKIKTSRTELRRKGNQDYIKTRYPLENNIIWSKCSYSFCQLLLSVFHSNSMDLLLFLSIFLSFVETDETEEVTILSTLDSILLLSPLDDSLKRRFSFLHSSHLAPNTTLFPLSSCQEFSRYSLWESSTK